MTDTAPHSSFLKLKADQEHPVPVEYLFLESARNRKDRIESRRDLHVGQVVDREAREMKIASFVPTDFSIPDRVRSGHFCCLGTTGTGKTKLMTYMICQDIGMGHNVAVLNPKSDPFGSDRAGNELLSYIVQACVQAGRLEDLLVVTPIFPDYSIELNPLRYYTVVDELIEHVISSVRSKEEYYENVAAEVSTAIITSLIAQEQAKRREVVLNLQDIKQRVDYKSLQNLGDAIEFFRNFPDEAVRGKIEEALLTIRQIGQSPQDFFAKVSSSLRTVLTTLTTSTTGKIIGRARSNEFVERVEAGEGVVFVCNTDSLLATRASHIINRVIVSMIKTMAGRINAEGKVFERPLAVYLDEGHNVLFRGIEELFNKGRSAGIYIHFFTQSLAQMITQLGQEATRSVVDNMNTWVFMRVNSPETMEYISKLAPDRDRWTPFVSLGAGEMSVTLRPEREPIFRPEVLSKLKQSYYYLKCDGRYYKGKVPRIPPPAIRVTLPALEGQK
jgi:hypothetical protein